MTDAAALGPLDRDGSVAAWRQTRLGWFLVSAYGGLARLSAAQSLLAPGAGVVVMNAASVQAGGIAAAVLRAVAWQPDWWVAMHLPRWEFSWLPVAAPMPGIPSEQALALDAAALGLAIVTVVRPMPLLPANADRSTPFAAALALAELEGGRLLQPFLQQMKSFVPDLPRAVAEASAERRTNQLRGMWNEVIAALGER